MGQCARKKMTKQAADMAAQRVGQRTGIRMYVMPCGVCGHYHVVRGK